ncbi:hypothetical protein D3C81_1323210 [compost metagenome]
MGLHDLELFSGEPSRFEQDAIGNANLADIVQRCRFEEQLDAVLVEKVPEARVVAQQFSQAFDVVLGTANVVAGFVVTGFGQRSHGVDGDILDGDHLPGAALHFPLQKFVLIAQEIGNGLELDLGLDPGHEHRGDDRLGDVIRSPEAQAANLVLRGSHGGEENDRYMANANVKLELLGNVITGQARHHDVQQDQIGKRVGLQKA